MPPELYQELEQRITVEFQRDRTLMRDPVSPGVKLAVTLRPLGTGDNYTTLHYAFRVASSTIEKFVPEVCYVLVLAVVAAVLAAVIVWNDVVELPAAASAAVALTSLANVAVDACFAVEPVHGSAVELVHAAE